jgi:hypothetical protein
MKHELMEFAERMTKGLKEGDVFEFYYSDGCKDSCNPFTIKNGYITDNDGDIDMISQSSWLEGTVKLVDTDIQKVEKKIARIKQELIEAYEELQAITKNKN